jgi:hypothetical protein
MTRFLNTVVRWTSKTNGRCTTKTGKIVATVPSGYFPREIVDTSQYDLRRLCQHKRGRPYASVLVAVEREGKRPLLYWPRVSDLEWVV